MKELILTNSGTEILRVHPQDITYIEADGNYCKMHLTGGFEQQLWFSKQRFLTAIIEQMKAEKPLFILVGRSLIVNLSYIYRVNSVTQELILFDTAGGEFVTLHASQDALAKLKYELSNNELLK